MYKRQPQLIRTAQRSPPVQGNRVLSQILVPQFQRRQFRVCLNALVIVKEDVVIHQLLCFGKRGDLRPVNAFRFKNGKEIFR